MFVPFLDLTLYYSCWVVLMVKGGRTGFVMSGIELRDYGVGIGDFALWLSSLSLRNIQFCLLELIIRDTSNSGSEVLLIF
jgi:hypothetical protein